MKKLPPKKLCLQLLLFLLISQLWSLSDSSIESALINFSKHIQNVPEDIQTVSLVPLYPTKENGFNESTFQKILEKKLLLNGFVLADRSKIDASFDEIKLSLSGLVDTSTVKEAGKIAGVDAFIFTDYTISGTFKNRITITIKVVDTATGAIIFVNDYYYEEPPPINLGFSLSYRYFSNNILYSTISADNTIEADWTETISESGFYPIVPAVFIRATIKPIRTSFNLGILIQNFTLNPGVNKTNIYVSDILYDKFDEGGFASTLFGITPYAEINIPISWLFGDLRDRLKLIIGGNLLSYDFKPTLWTAKLNVGLSFAVLPSVEIFTDIGIYLPWEKVVNGIEGYQGITIIYRRDLAAELSFGVSILSF